jgi:hypothetical protein
MAAVVSFIAKGASSLSSINSTIYYSISETRQVQHGAVNLPVHMKIFGTLHPRAEHQAHLGS